MLVGLRLQNIALLDSLELNFQGGLTVLTGETGAGKSILLDALDALFGGNQVTPIARLLSHGSKRGQIEGTFLTNLAVDTWLNDEGLENEENELLISRELRYKGDRLINRCRINGVLVNRFQISALRPLLIDFTVQGQIHQLASSKNQLQWLDHFGKDSIQEKLAKVKSSWFLWKEAFEALEKAKKDRDELNQQSQDQADILQDLDSAELTDPFEDQKLQLEEDRLVNAVRLQEGIVNLFNRLEENVDEFPSVLDHLSFCIHELRLMSKFDSSLDKYENEVLDLQLNLQELISNLNKYATSLDSDSARLEEIQERLALLKKLQRRYDKDLPHLCKYRDELHTISMIHDVDQLIHQLETKENLFRDQRDHNNLTLRKARESAALKFEKHLMNYLLLLGLSNIRFKVQLSSSQPNHNGTECIQFLFSANPGHSLNPLGEVASGGEMSRFLLALKTVLSNVDGSSTLLFDEIDSGVSGRVSGAIADVLKDLAANRQVFCVTHQPLIAAVADNHFRVVKYLEAGRTRSDVLHLSDIQDRQSELAELAGGDFAEARAYAASLLDHKAA